MMENTVTSSVSLAEQYTMAPKFSRFEEVDTPQGKGLFQYYLDKKGCLFAVVSQSRGRLEKEGVTITGIWRLLFLEPGEVIKIRGALCTPDSIFPRSGIYYKCLETNSIIKQLNI
jgi:hypothetical protein